MADARTPLDQFLERYRGFARSTGWGVSRLAREAGLADRTLKDIFEPDWNPTSDTLRKLEAIIPADWQPPAAATAAE